MNHSEGQRFRERFWANLPVLPGGLAIDRVDSLVVPQTGPGGLAVFDLVILRTPGKELPALVAYRPKVLPGEAVGIGKRLRTAEAQLRLRDRALSIHRVLVIATEAAGASTIRVCERERIGILDLRGTVILQAPELFVKVIGERAIKREPRTPLFRGKGARVVRTLLNAPAEIRTIRALSTAIESSYAYTFDVIARLEQAGFVFRRSPRTGVVLRDPVGLLRAWLESGEGTVVSIEPFYARSTTEASLRKGLERLRERGGQAVFTLGSGIDRESTVVTALPHGVYSSASTQLLQEAFDLRRQSPHNFLVLHPDPAADTDKGGIGSSLRALPQGPAVSVPQLIVDLYGLGGRAKEQAESLLEGWARTLPIVDTP